MKSELLKKIDRPPSGLLESILFWYVERLARQGRERIVWKNVNPEATGNLTGDVYLARYYVWPAARDDESRDIDQPWRPRILLHHIAMKDEDRHMHDHPWSFLSFVLQGSYYEERPHPTFGWPRRFGALRRERSLAFRPASSLHRVQSIRVGGVWTVLLCGQRQREWGYLTETGWVRWDRYWGLDKDGKPQEDLA